MNKSILETLRSIDILKNNNKYDFLMNNIPYKKPIVSNDKYNQNSFVITLSDFLN